MTAIRRLLVANRGEIARRVFATCRRLGIETVAVHSDADAELPFVREADFAVRLPGNAPTETYLRGDLVIEAARTAGADAVHPGYGFLSENAAFARDVIDAGLTWVGPDPGLDRGDGLEDRGQEADGRRRGAGARRARAVRGDRGRPAGPGQGLGRRRWPRHADRAHPRLPGRRGRQGRGGGSLCLRRRHRLHRAVRRARSPRRGTGRRRPPRRRARPRRARLLAAAAAPEGRRGVARPRDLRRPADHAARCGTQRRQGDRVRRRRHGRVHGRRRARASSWR